MKKIIVSVLFVIIIIVGGIISYNLFEKNEREELKTFILETLNGYNIEEKGKNINSTVYNWGIDYQNTFLCNDNTTFILMEDVDSFNKYIKKAEELDKILEEDPFCVIENVIPESELELFNKYFPYYNKDGVIGVNDIRVFEENNKYLVKVQDINFINSNFDYLFYGKFQIYVDKSEIKKETFTQRQKANRFSYLSFLEVNNVWAFKFYDDLMNKTITVDITKGLFNIKSCVITN